MISGYSAVAANTYRAQGHENITANAISGIDFIL
jgi:hypothetical protein